MNSTPVHPDTFHAAVWAACDALRGALAPGLGRDLAVTLLFLKAISDAWQDRLEDCQRRHGAHPGLVEELLRNERFVLPAGAGFQALHAARYQPGNGQRIDRALQALEGANPAKLRGLFRDISFNTAALGDESHKNDVLRRLLEAFAGLSLREGRAGAAGEFLVGRFAAQGPPGAGECYTPPEVSLLLARLADPQPGEQICDPACGSGSLLAQCGRLVREHGGSRHYALHGQETAASAWALARMNLFLHGEDNHRIEWGDTLRNPRLLDEDGRLLRFDVVVAQPPLAVQRWDAAAGAEDRHQRFRRGLPPRTRADYAFILHMVETLKPGTGRMAVVVPHGVLFRAAAEGQIRRRIVAENLLEAVIGLPEKLFHGTGIPAAVLVLRRNKPDDKVLFVDASRDCQQSKSQNRLRGQDLDRIVAACAARQSVPGHAHLAGPDEIAGHGFNLHIPRYVQAGGAPAGADLATARTERDRLVGELARLGEQIDGYLRELGHG
jgi:type I restriction enzyme M protein